MIVMGALNVMKFYDIFTIGLEEHLVDFFPVSVKFSLRQARCVAFGEVGSGKNLSDVHSPHSNIFKLLNQTTDVLVDYIWI